MRYAVSSRISSLVVRGGTTNLVHGRWRKPKKKCLRKRCPHPTSAISPYCSKTARRDWSVVSHGKPRTKIFLLTCERTRRVVGCRTISLQQRSFVSDEYHTNACQHPNTSPRTVDSHTFPQKPVITASIRSDKRKNFQRNSYQVSVECLTLVQASGTLLAHVSLVGNPSDKKCGFRKQPHTLHRSETTFRHQARARWNCENDATAKVFDTFSS